MKLEEMPSGELLRAWLATAKAAGADAYEAKVLKRELVRRLEYYDERSARVSPTQAQLEQF